MKRSTRTILICFLLLMLASAFVLVLFILPRPGEQAAAMNATQRMVIRYVETYGQAPTSWSDLALLTPPDSSFPLPGHESILRRNVRLDLGHPLDEIAKASPKSFPYIQPLPKPYYDYTRHYETIIVASRAAMTRPADAYQQAPRRR